MARLGAHADASIDRNIHNVVCIETGSYSMRKMIGAVQE